MDIKSGISGLGHLKQEFLRKPSAIDDYRIDCRFS